MMVLVIGLFVSSAAVVVLLCRRAPCYRYLEKGEMIEAGDEVDASADGWRDEPAWIQTTSIGDRAPDPQYPAHRQYRRRLSWLSRIGQSIGLAAIVLLTSPPAWADAFDELNAQRAHLGLPPMIEDPAVTKWAQAKAEYQAARGIKGFQPDSAIPTGLTGHEGPIYPGKAGTWVEGTGCSRDGYWMTCAMRSIGQPRAGAGIAIGPDGARYMVLLVLAKSPREGGARKPLKRTAHLTPDAPRVAPAGGGFTRSKRGQPCRRCGRVH